MLKKFMLVASSLLLPAVATRAEAPAAATPEQIEEGKKLYMTICIACHQPTGAGLPPVFPSLVKSEYVSGSPERLVAMVLKGIMPPFKYKDVVYTQLMIAQETVLTDDKIAWILTFVRASFENNAPPITPEFAANVRKKLAERKVPWTEPELNNWKDDAPATAAK